MGRSVEKAVFGGGCFWCTEAVFQPLKGVISVRPGYAGGTTENPNYEAVCSGSTGHAEVVQIEFDPNTISYRDLLEIFFSSHDPTTLNRQGNDVGEQYRSIILYATAEQKKTAEEYIGELTDAGVYQARIVTEVKPLKKFYEAESYHQDYYRRNSSRPYCQAVIAPKLAKVRQKHSKWLK